MILPTDSAEIRAGKALADHIPPLYWNAAGALYAYLFMNLSRQAIDVIGESQLVGYPSQFPSVSMMDWKTGKPNARYWVLKLIKDNFAPGDQLVYTAIAGDSEIDSQAFITPSGRKLLILNKRNRRATVELPESIAPYEIEVVDRDTDDGPPRVAQGSALSVELEPFAVAIVIQK